MESIQLEAFATILVQKVRDSVAPEYDFRGTLDNRMSDAKRWRQMKDAGQFGELLSGIIAEYVDITLFYVLHAIDYKHLMMAFTCTSGDLTDLFELGKMEKAGYYASHTWTVKYSSTRFNNWFPDMPPEIDDMN